MIQSFQGYVPSAPQPPPPTPTQIEAWVKKATREAWCGGPVYSGWASDLWSKQYDEIVNFLIERFETTLCEPEYYFCILYLGKHVPKEALYVPFKFSPQYQEMIGMPSNVCRKKNVTINAKKTLNTHKKFTIRR